MILSAPDDRSFPNGPSYRKGDPVDVAELADVLGVDADDLAADLAAQGWPEARKPAAKKAAKKTAPASAGDDPAPEGADTKES